MLKLLGKRKKNEPHQKNIISIKYLDLKGGRTFWVKSTNKNFDWYKSNSNFKKLKEVVKDA